MTTRTLHRAPLRRRPYVLNTAEVTATRSRRRQTILTPAKGYRIRLIRVKVVQPVPDDRHSCELYFGTAGSLTTDPSPRRGHPRGAQRRCGLHPDLPPRPGSPRIARRIAQLSLAGQTAIQRSHGDHRVHRGELGIWNAELGVWNQDRAGGASTLNQNLGALRSSLSRRERVRVRASLPLPYRIAVASRVHIVPATSHRKCTSHPGFGFVVRNHCLDG